VPDKIKVTPERRSEPNLRKLARALIRLASREAERESTKHHVTKPRQAGVPGTTS
jgi:hypothetical protein